MREKWLVRLGAALGALLLAAWGQAAAGAVPAAASTISGGGTFSISMYLSSFPCPQTCTSSFSGTFAGQVSGVDSSGNPYTVEFPDPTVIPPLPGPNFGSTGMSNGDACNTPTTTGDPAILVTTGTASGTFAITDGQLTRGTVRSHGVQLSGGFFWSRTAAAGTLGLSAVVVTDGSGATVSSGTLGLAAGGASFSVPPTTAATATCNAPAQTVTATVSGLEVASI